MKSESIHQSVVDRVALLLLKLPEKSQAPSSHSQNNSQKAAS